ncbi:hypothetical protein C8J57DRAFT_1502568 [Mycena rebaudengoi]|nr:hypothetical protein C8J57DRAFT_1502568 [Mycena rebaudengoi]
MLMSVLQMVWSLTITTYSSGSRSCPFPLRPWFSRIDTYPALFIPQPVLTSFYVAWWMVPASTAGFVAFFAFGCEALDEYAACFRWLRARHSSSTHCPPPRRRPDDLYADTHSRASSYPPCEADASPLSYHHPPLPSPASPHPAFPPSVPVPGDRSITGDSTAHPRPLTYPSFGASPP